MEVPTKHFAGSCQLGIVVFKCLTGRQAVRREPSLSQRYTAKDKSQWARAATREIAIRCKEEFLLRKGTEH